MPKAVKRLRLAVSSDPDTYIAQYLALLNGMLHLHPRQLEVLIAVSRHGNVINTRVRKAIKNELNFRTSDALNMIVKELKNKGILLPLEKRGELEIHRSIQLVKVESLIFELSEADGPSENRQNDSV